MSYTTVELGSGGEMNILVPIPDEFAAKLGVSSDIGRRALEALGLEEYRAGRVSRPELRRLLGFETRFELDGFLKARGLHEGMTLAEFEADQQTLDQLGL